MKLVRSLFVTLALSAIAVRANISPSEIRGEGAVSVRALPTIDAVVPGFPVGLQDRRQFDPPTLTIAIEPDLPMTFQRVRSTRNPGGTVTWVGRNALRGASLVAIGSAQRWDAVLSLAGGQYEVHVDPVSARLVARDARTDCSPSAPSVLAPPAVRHAAALSTPGIAQRDVGGTAQLVSRTVYTVDVVFFYSADAEQEAVNGHDGIPGYVSSIDEVPAYLDATYRAYIETNNLVLEQSHVRNLRWNYLGVFRVPDYTPKIDHTMEDPYTGKTITFYDITYDAAVMADPTTAVGAFVAQTCEELGADQAVLLVADPRTYGGVANRGEGTPNMAVVTLTGPNLTVAHEMGHNFGLRHDRATDSAADGDGIYAYGYKFSYSYVFPFPDGARTVTDQIGDVMSYGIQQPYYSNPDVVITEFSFAAGHNPNYGDNLYSLGVEVGQPTAANAARTLREAASTMAAVRTLSGQQLPSIDQAPVSGAIAFGGALHLAVAASGPALTYQWARNGVVEDGATGVTFDAAGLTSAGLYDVAVTNRSGTAVTLPAIVGFTSSTKAEGQASVVSTSVRHPNGNLYDQVLLTGAAATVTAEPGKVTRTSFIDPDGDIVQVEFAGAGTLSIVLSNAGGPATPEKYTQDVSYMQGLAGIVITGADESTNVSVFSVGRATAFDPTGGFNIVLPISPANDPANNGSPLFAGHGDTVYDGVADIALIAIASIDGKFGGVRAANARFSASGGYVGVVAPGVEFLGPVYVGNIAAEGDAVPMLRLGTVTDVRVTGGDLWQPNSEPVQVSGITLINFTDGSDSQGRRVAAQGNRAVLLQDGVDVTSSVVAP